MSWKKLPSVDKNGIHLGCLNCSSVTKKLDMDRILSVGFGDVIISRDGEVLYTECGVRNNEYATAKEAEKMAMEDPGHDWRIWFFAPLYEEEYQRHGKKEWLLVKSGPGFA